MFTEMQVRRLFAEVGGLRNSTGTEGAQRIARFVEIAQARLSGEAEACRPCRPPKSPTDVENDVYRLLAAQELSTWRLLQRQLAFSPRPGARVAWMREVLSWLEGEAPEPSMDCDKRAALLPQQIRATGNGSTTPGRITALDPDSCSRQAKAWHTEDVNTADPLVWTLWNCVRAGDVQAAQQCCRNSSEWWRAASLTPAGSDSTGSELAAWQQASYMLAKDSATPQLERAIYAVLCANPAALDEFRSNDDSGIHGALRTWYDKLFVWVKIWVGHHGEASRAALGTRSQGQMQTSLKSFLQACNAKTDEDNLVEEFANAVGTYKDVVKPWVVHALNFFRALQQHLIFNFPDRSHGNTEDAIDNSHLWADAPDGVFPHCLRFHIQTAEAEVGGLPSYLRQLGNDLSSQLIRVSLHAGLLLTGSTAVQMLGQDRLLDRFVTEYMSLLASVAEDCPDDLPMVAEYTNWLSTPAQPVELAGVLSGMTTASWKRVLCGSSPLSPVVVAEVQQTLVHSLESNFHDRGSESEVLDALEWACSHVIEDSADGLLARMQGLREVNTFLRGQILEEGTRDGASAITALFTSAATSLCLDERMNAHFGEICEQVRPLFNVVHVCACHACLFSASEVRKGV